MKLLIYIALVFILCCSCKSPQKVINDSKLNIETNESNDLLLTNEQELIKLSEQIIERLTNEKLNIDITHLKYDANEHMIEQTEIKISKDTEVNEASSVYHCEEDVINTEVISNSQIETKIEAESRKKEIRGFSKWQKALIMIGGCAILGLIIFIRYKS
ncbi:hypothetical protein [Bacteroides sp. 224]|uniref:hypothetical protein n=1 Tax=Bacteroides sp. 224 TaxID=2302936 RepID=UPI0013D7D3D2|nr:hypothetical protein [Bacteroides sp. 224]NDV64195.1 hypothetical protein [Bacteroides sp. 224]